MGHSIWEPDLLLRNIRKKKQQLGEIERDLENLPLDHPERHRLFERRWHLEKAIPTLEAEYTNRTGEREMGSGDSHSHDRPGRATLPDDRSPQKTTRQDKIVFAVVRGRDGGSIEQPEFSDMALLNTYESSRSFRAIQTCGRAGHPVQSPVQS
jgi:hypothetical protein